VYSGGGELFSALQYRSARVIQATWMAAIQGGLVGWLVAVGANSTEGLNDRRWGQVLGTGTDRQVWDSVSL
jgi:hypothetical protein